MSSIANVPPNVLESLKMFDGLVNVHKSYRIPDSTETNSITVPPEIDLPELSDDNFFKFKKWFDKFERVAHKKRFTREEIVSIITHHVPKCRYDSVAAILKDPNLVTIFDIQVRLVAEFFKNQLVLIVMVSLMQNTKETSIPKIVRKFLAKCESLYLVCVALKKECPISKTLFVTLLLKAIPPNAMNTLFLKYPCLEEVELVDFIRTLMKECSNSLVERKILEKVFTAKHTYGQIQDSIKQMERLPSKCYCCGERTHLRTNCPDKNKYCSKCGKKGHLEIMCAYQPNYRKMEKEFSNIKKTLRKLYWDLYVIDSLIKKIKKCIKIRQYIFSRMDKDNEEKEKVIKRRKLN